MRISGPLALLGLCVCLASGRRTASAETGPSDIPIVDLREHAATADASQLVRGAVAGVVVPIAGSPLLTAFYSTKNALTLKPHFRAGGCEANAGEIGTWLSLEAPDDLAQAPTSIGLWMERGVLVFSLVTERDSALATSAQARPPGPIYGLTTAGRAVAQNIIASGGLIDVSGLSDLSLDEVIALAKAARIPVIATHSNARRLADQHWNLSDDQLRRIGQTGGVIGVSFERRLLVHGRNAAVRNVVNQIQHIATIAGIDHVAIGSGLGGGNAVVHELDSPSAFPRLALALERSGMSRGDIQKVFNGNARRVLCGSVAASPKPH